MITDGVTYECVTYLCFHTGTNSIYWRARDCDRGNGYLSWSNTDWGAFLSNQWLWGLVGAIIVGLLLIVMLARGSRSQAQMFASAPRPEGLRLVGALLWEGLVHGMAEGLLLSVLPVLITWATVNFAGANWCSR